MESTRNRLITLLAKNKDTYISGQTLSEQLNISRSAIWKHMNELKKDGYIIEGIPKKGYRIITSPEKVSENTLQWGLETEWLGQSIVHKQSTSSTQTIAHQLAQEGCKHGTVVIADQQVQGKGRLNRKWESTDKKGIWMSLILRPEISPQLAPQLTLLTATVLADVLKNHLHITPQIKWPNDILINDKKVAGILTEMQAEQDQIKYIIIGIGMNVLHEELDLPDHLLNKATSLGLETDDSLDLRSIIQETLTVFEQTYKQYLNEGFKPIKKNWEHYGFKIGKLISVKTLTKQWNAIFSGIDEDGALLIRNSDGTNEKLYSAEINWFNDLESTQ